MQKFVQGALFLMLASFITRILAFIYRIYIVRLIGSEGIGLYEMVFPIYSLILVLTTAGLPVAVSKLVSEDFARHNTAQVKKTFFVALVFLLCSGLISTVCIIWIAPYLTERIFSDARVYWPFVIAIPAIFIVAIGSAFRGYFQGIQNMKPSAASQIIEQLTRIFIGIFVATILLPYGIEFAAAGLAAAMVCGELSGLIVLLICFFRNKEINVPSFGQTNSIAKTLFTIYGLAIPVTLTRIVSASSLTLQAIIIPNRLIASGLSIREATQIYGQFSGMAFSLINLPTIITVSLAITLVPAISEALAMFNFSLIKKRTSQAFRITILTAIPCSIIFLQLSQSIMTLLFSSPETGIVLKALAYGCPFFYLQQTSNGILQGLGKVSIIFRNVLIGTVINITGIYWLTAIPGIGIKGTAAAVIGGAATIACLNFISILKFTNLKIYWKDFLFYPLAAGGVMLLAIDYMFLNTTSNILNWTQLLSIIFLGLAAYVITLLVTGCIKISDLAFIKNYKS